MTCFFRCLPGMNKLSTYCEKIEYALTSNCHNCPAEIIDWAKGACLDYQVSICVCVLCVCMRASVETVETRSTPLP